MIENKQTNIMKTKLAVVAAMAIALNLHAQVSISPVFPRVGADPAYVYVTGTQIGGNEFQLQGSLDGAMTWSFTGAFWACYAFTQDITARFNAEIFADQMFRSVNTPCSPLLVDDREIPLNDYEKQARWIDNGQNRTRRILKRLPDAYRSTFPFDPIQLYVTTVEL